MSPQGVLKASLVSLTVCAGTVLIADGLHTTGPASQPTAAQAFQAPQPAMSGAVRPAYPALALAPAAAPTRVRIPAIGVDAPLTGLVLDAGRHLAAPPESDRNLAGWYRDGTSPGAVGTAVIAGDVDTRGGPAVFHRLGTMKKGDAVSVDRADGRTAVFTVDAVEAYDARAFPDEKVYGAATRAELRLVTCGAGFDTVHNRYLGNVVVFAHLTGVEGTAVRR